MAVKRTRLEMLRNLLQSRRFESQEELLQALREEGFKLAQPTLSRDLRILKVSKVCTEDGGYAYTLPDTTDAEQKRQMVPYGFKEVFYSGNMAVIKTVETYAHSLAYEIDKTNAPGVIGTVAGDDTIIVVFHEGFRREDFNETLKQILPNYDE